MSIQFFAEDVKMPSFNHVIVKKILKNEVIEHGFKLGAVNYIFCSDFYLLKINVQFLNHDYYTDVITFDYTVDKLIVGDIYISTDMVQYNSVNFEQEFSEELLRVIAHGFLHLMKFNDKEKDEIEIMRRKENEFLKKFKDSLIS